jgi:hypothetical protein
MYQMYADMVKNSLNGVEKIIYLPSNGENNPLSFFPFQMGTIPGVIPTTKKN